MYSIIKEKKMNINEIDVKTLLPQQEPFVMISCLDHCDSKITRTSLTILKENIFVEDLQFSEFGIIENFAQTCAARMGYIYKILNNSDVKLGFIGAVRNFKLYRKPRIGETMKTEIEIQSEIFNITLTQAQAWVNDELIAQCEMKISE
jgi:3-hydroxymyristoyl/3-hydroxydecanoyl-(acyl carrier protein) dehydratase